MEVVAGNFGVGRHHEPWTWRWAGNFRWVSPAQP